MKKIKNKSSLIAVLLSTIIISNCGGPNIESIKEPVLGTEKHKLSGYGFSNREKSVSAGLVLSCTPSSKNNTILNGTLYIGSLSNEYSFDEKVKLFLEINGIRHQLNVISRNQSTGELGKNFLNLLVCMRQQSLYRLKLMPSI